MATACRRVSLGTAGHIREQKVEWTNDGPFGTPSPTLRCRDGWNEAYAEFCAEEVTLNEVWNDVEQCAVVGAAAAGVAAIFASPSAALPAFKTAFYACLKAKVAEKADSVHVDLAVEHRSGDWGGC